MRTKQVLGLAILACALCGSVTAAEASGEAESKASFSETR